MTEWANWSGLAFARLELSKGLFKVVRLSSKGTSENTFVPFFLGQWIMGVFNWKTGRRGTDIRSEWQVFKVQHL